MAAQGALPLKPEDLVELLTDLYVDPDASVREAAEKSLHGVPAAELVPIGKARETPAKVLAWLVTNRKEKEVREVVLQNTSLSEETTTLMSPEHPADTHA